MSTPNTNVSNGIIITPPPKPVSAPNKPAKKAPINTMIVNSNTDIAANISYTIKTQ